jgi:hypothetical protein
MPYGTPSAFLAPLCLLGTHICLLVPHLPFASSICLLTPHFEKTPDKMSRICPFFSQEAAKNLADSADAQP